MKTLTQKEYIKAPPEVVFRVVTDWNRMLELEDGLESIDFLSEIKEGVGLWMRWNYKQEGNSFSFIEEIVEHDPPREIAWREYEEGGETFFAAGSHTLVPAEEGRATRLTMAQTFYGEFEEEWAVKMIAHITATLKELSEKEMENKK